MQRTSGTIDTPVCNSGKLKWTLAMAGIACAGLDGAIHAQTLPEAPSAVMMASVQQDKMPPRPSPGTSATLAKEKLPPCETLDWGWKLRPKTAPPQPCEQNPLQMIVGEGSVAPLTPAQKAELAVHNIVDPFNLITITGYAGIYVAADSHSPYGPGLKGFGRLTGYSLAEDTQGEFFGVYAIPVLAHEDPRYHRMPHRPVKIRVLHALAHTVIANHDDGSLMPNYATLLTYPLSAELSNLYVPGIGRNGPSTIKRIGLGYATDPSGALIAEFLPDVAKRIHVRVVFVQEILNQIATRSGNQ
jgi:hypothetical protein